MSLRHAEERRSRREAGEMEAHDTRAGESDRQYA
jgi:hypothetical protein